jgi:hypothetical protein
MAKKPAAAAAAHEVPPAMDYAQHNGTYQGFMTMLKYSIISLVLIVLALYCFIEAGQPILGTLLLLVIPVGAVAMVVMGSRRS